MRFIDWLFFWWVVSDDDDDGGSVGHGCLFIIALIAPFVALHLLLDFMGVDGGINRVYQLYIFTSFWDFFVTSPLADKEGFKLTVFISTMIGLLVITYMFLIDVSEDILPTNKFKAFIYWFFVTPHMIFLTIRVILMIFFD